MNCDIIKDIIPLYAENLCSAESSAMVEEHIQTCESCRRLLENPTGVPAETDAPDESAAKPFRKVNRRMKIRTVFIVLLIVILLAVLIPLGYLTYCQIFKPEGGVSFDTLIIEAQARPVAEMIAEGRAGPYVDSLSEISMNFNTNIIGDTEYFEAMKEKIVECYQPVKKYSPDVMEVKAGFFGSGADYSVTARIRFHTSPDKWFFYDFCLMRHYDGKFLVTNTITDADFFANQTNDREAAEAIARYINAIIKAGAYSDIAATRAIETTLNADRPLSDAKISYMADRVSRYFVQESRKSVYDGIYDYFSSGFDARVHFSNFYFDREKQMQFYIVTLEGAGRTSDETKVISARIYADERGMYPPEEKDFFGIQYWKFYSDSKTFHGRLIHFFG